MIYVLNFANFGAATLQLRRCPSESGRAPWGWNAGLPGPVPPAIAKMSWPGPHKAEPEAAIQPRRCYLPASVAVATELLPPQPNNFLHTTKFGRLVTCIPKLLYEECSRVANLYFLCIAVLQLTTDLSLSGRYSTIVPLAFVVLISIVRQLLEDSRRHAVDCQVNGRAARVLRNGTFVSVRWCDVSVGDIVRVEDGEEFPADLAILSTTREDGFCYVDTANLDGETQLKMRQAISTVTQSWQSAASLQDARGYVDYEQPSPSVYSFRGSFVPLAANQRPVALNEWFHARGA